MDVTIKLSDGTEQVYHIFISSISVDKKQHTKIICRNRRGSGLMKPLLSYLTNNPDVKPVHILITSENDMLLNYDITDYCYKLNFILSDKNKPFTETLSLW